ncbi:MAG: thioredoxin family protein [Spirochaetaceae bacterium]
MHPFRFFSRFSFGLPKLSFFVFLLTLLMATLFAAAPLHAQIEGLEMNEPSGDESSDVPSRDESSDVPSSASPPAASVEFVGTDSLSDGTPSLSIPKGETARFEVVYTIPQGYYQEKQEEMFTVSSPSGSPVVIEHIEYPEGEVKNGTVTYEGETVIEVVAGVKAEAAEGEHEVPITASYQLCDEGGTCFFPEEERELFEITISRGSAAGTSAGTAAGGASESGASGTTLAGLLRFFLFAFIGGVLLNIMPCVLPVLSLRAINLVKQSGSSRRELFTGSLLYSGGIVISLTALAAVVVILKLSGEMVGWGFQFQNPWFVVFLAAVIFVFALSLFDVYVFQPPTMGGSLRKAGEKGYIGSFFNGIIAVLLATPCTAPLLGPALGFAFSQPTSIIFTMFFLIGLGFSLPFLLLGVWPSLIQKLPTPGPWMNTFKELMGFLLLATVVYLLSILEHQISAEGLLRVLLFLLLLGFFLWILGKVSKPSADRKKKWIILIVLIILTVSAGGRILRFEAPAEAAAAATVREGWEAFEPEKLESYRKEGKPVFVVFSAKWCTVCTVNEQTVLFTETADTLFEERGIAVLYGDYTNKDPLLEEWIRSYGRAGVPVYAYYSPEADSYTLLPEVLTQDILKKRLN